MVGIRKAIEYLSIHMEKQDAKYEEFEATHNEQGMKYDKLGSDSEMHYNVIMRLVHSS